MFLSEGDVCGSPPRFQQLRPDPLTSYASQAEGPDV